MQLLDFNDIPLPDRVAVYEIPATATVSRMAVAGKRVGGYALGTKRETRKYTASGLFLRSETYPYDADRIIDQLRGMVGLPGTLRQKMRDGSVRRCDAILISCKAEHNNQSAVSRAQPLALEFESDEFWHDDALTVSDLTNATNVYAVNVGNAATTRLKLTITSAIASHLTITNTANGEALTYGTAKANGVVLVIDCETGTVTIDGVNAYASATRADTQIALLSLAAGENILSFNVPVTGRVEYRGCFV